MTTLLHTTAPDICLTDQDDREHTLSQYHGLFVLLYFYPKDMTPGCTVEAQGFRDSLNDLQAANLQVLGVSSDTCESHKQFAQRHHLNFPLLADTEHVASQAYGVYEEVSIFGTTAFQAKRESFLIDPSGIVVKHYQKVDPKNHAQEVLRDVQLLQAPATDE